MSFTIVSDFIPPNLRETVLGNYISVLFLTIDGGDKLAKIVSDINSNVLEEKK